MEPWGRLLLCPPAIPWLQNGAPFVAKWLCRACRAYQLALGFGLYIFSSSGSSVLYALFLFHLSAWQIHRAGSCQREVAAPPRFLLCTAEAARLLSRLSGAASSSRQISRAVQRAPQHFLPPFLPSCVSFEAQKHPLAMRHVIEGTAKILDSDFILIKQSHKGMLNPSRGGILTSPWCNDQLPPALIPRGRVLDFNGSLWATPCAD